MTTDIFDLKDPSGRGTIELPIEPRVDRGTTDIDDSAQTETTAWLLLTIAAPADAALMDVEVWVDLVKASTGFGAVESTATLKLSSARAVDGTNFRTGPDLPQSSTAITGTNATADADQAAVIRVGDIPAGESARIYGDMSADATSDIELPYAVYYKSRGTITVTPVAAA